MTDKLTDEAIAAIRDGTDGVTPGEWEYYSHKPGSWREPENPAAMVNSNGDKVIDCTWASATEEGDRTYRHIARCDPDSIRAIAEELLEARAEIARLTAELQESRLTELAAHGQAAENYQEVLRLRAALKPFSACLKGNYHYQRDDAELFVLRILLTIGDLRCASDALGEGER